MIEQLAAEYCRLLVGPKGHVSPVESVWADNQFQSKTAASMRRFFELIPDYVPESNLSDHLGVQLDFLGDLIDRTEAGASDEITKHFVAVHLNWVPGFLDRVEQRDDSKFYSGLASVTRGLIQMLPT
jgi:TorA maturation chaperone TorD